jgi:hypothetical protein
MIRLRSEYAMLGMPLAFIPNQDGFRFVGWTGREAIPCRVVRGEDGLHRVDGCEYGRLIGWFYELTPTARTRS